MVVILVIGVNDMDLNQVVDAIKTNYQLIGGLVGLLALIVYFIKALGKISYLEASKETYDAKIKALEEKYETSEKIKKTELDVKQLSADVTAEKEYVREHIKKIELDIKQLSADVTAEKEYVREHIFNINNLISNRSTVIDKKFEGLESRIESLKEEMKTHKINHPTNPPYQ